jgi:hypothetical protein
MYKPSSQLNIQNIHVDNGNVLLVMALWVVYCVTRDRTEQGSFPHKSLTLST